MKLKVQNSIIKYILPSEKKLDKEDKELNISNKKKRKIQN